jgi:hypothetical protein
MELMPDSRIPFDYNIIQLAGTYYRCGKTEQGNNLVNELTKDCNDKLAYYLDQNQKFISVINDEVLYNFQVLQNLINLSKTNEQEEISKQIEQTSEKLYSLYNTKMGQLR